MKSRNLLGLCSLLALFSACGNGAPKYDVTGTFETTEVLVSAKLRAACFISISKKECC